MAQASDQTGLDHMRALETKLDRLSAERRTRFIDSYLVWLANQALELHSLQGQEGQEAHLNAIAILFGGAPANDEAAKKVYQETYLILSLIIGDGSGEDFATRYARAVKWRTLVMNIFRGLQGIQPLSVTVSSEDVTYGDIIQYHQDKIDFWREKEAEAQAAAALIEVEEEPDEVVKEELEEPS